MAIKMSEILPSGTVLYTCAQTCPSGFVEANGGYVSRAISEQASLASAIYCGDSKNATAEYGYRFTDIANPSTSRNITGNYVKLPDLRGEFIRGWDNGRGLDLNRQLGSKQLGTIIHAHTTQAVGVHGSNADSWSGDAGYVPITINRASGQLGYDVTSYGQITRPHNVAMMAIIKL